MKVITGKSKVVILNGEEELEYEVCVDGMLLDRVSELNILDVL